jgi:hypothetical protein
VGLTLNGTYQILAYTDDVNLLGVNIDTVKKNTETLIDANKEVGLEINVEKIKHILQPRQKLRQKEKETDNLKVSELKYLGTTVTNKNLIREEIKRETNSGNAYYNSTQSFLSFSLLYKKRKHLNKHNYNFTCGSIRVRNLVSDIKGGCLRTGC